MKKLVILLVVMAIAGAIWMLTRDRDPEVPDLPDLAGYETAVQEKIRRTHASLSDDPGAADGWGRWAIVLHAHGFLDEAAHAYDVVLELEDSSSDRRAGSDLFRWLYLKGCVLEKRDVAASVKSFESALGSRDGVLSGHLRLGNLYEAQEEHEKALRQFELADAIRPTSHASLGFGRVLLARGDLKGALRKLEVARKRDPYHREVQEALARAYGRQGRKAAAEKATLRVNSLKKKVIQDEVLSRVLLEDVSFVGIRNRALVFLRRGRPQEALTLIDTAVAIDPENPDALFDRATILYVLARHEDAMECCDKVLEIRLDDVDSMDLKANCLLALKRVDEARGVLNEALRVENDSVFILATYASALVGDRPQDALKMLGRALEKDPYHTKSLFLSGTILHRIGKSQDALPHVKKLLEVEPLHADGHYLQALAYKALNRRDEAIAGLNELIGFAPRYIPGLYLLANMLASQGDVGGATRHLQSILKIRPGHPEATQALRLIGGKQP